MNEKVFSDIEQSELDYSQDEVSGVRIAEQSINDLVGVDWDKYIKSLMKLKSDLCKSIPKLQEVVDARTERIKKEIGYYKSIHRDAHSDWNLFISDESIQSGVYSDLAGVRNRINMVRELLHEDTLRLEQAISDLLSLGYKLEVASVKTTVIKDKDGNDKSIQTKKYKPVRQINITGKIEWARSEKAFSKDISTVGYKQSVGIID